MTTLPLVPPPQYVCPGSADPVTRAVHEARLAAGDRRCRDCAFGDPHDTSETGGRTDASENWRGQYGRDLTPADAERIGLAFAAWLAGRDDFGRDAPVAIGCGLGIYADAVAAGLGRGLRMAGRDTSDFGRLPAVAWSFGLGHVDAGGGVFVTADPRNEAVVELEFADGRGLPVAGDVAAREIVTPPETPSRPTRRGGRAGAFDASVPYQAGLWRHFRHVGPTRVLCHAGSEAIAGVLRRLAGGLPIDLRVGPDSDTDPPDDFGDRVLACGAEVGVAVSPDGRSGRVFGADGAERLPTEQADQILRLAEIEGRRACILDWELIDALESDPRRESVVPTRGTATSMAAAMIDHRADRGFDATGRPWTADPLPRADFLVALPHIVATAKFMRRQAG
ncbi:MAG: hypothetical protein AAF532_05475 [Planctomycetota bacterium]